MDTHTQEVWDRVQLARHPERPHTLDYIRQVFGDFVEMHGDRLYGDDAAIIGGPAKLGERTVMLLGHQKGANTKENVARNFGMASPEGYRKALRLMRHAEKFGFPVITFIDTPGASPGLESEERGMALAIADDLLAMLTLRVPILAVVIGEGGSGGALAIGLADRILMLENAIYSVASPESAASILWHNAGQAPQAAAAMKIRAEDLRGFGIVDRVIKEPKGGAQSNVPQLMERVGAALREELDTLDDEAAGPSGISGLLRARREKYMRLGAVAANGD
ncbi:MAG: acetyl-CoA carboxylase carboxyltransferase subunit alpha [Chloroflexia bacterium]